MITYVYKTTQVTIAVNARNEDHGYRLLCEKIQELLGMGVEVPNAREFRLDTIY